MKEHKTFKQYLTELDAADLQIAYDHALDKQKKVEYSQDADEFKQNMDASRNKPQNPESPQKGDILLAKGKKYVVGESNAKGFYVRELGANKNASPIMVKHGYKFAQVETTELGKRVFKVTK